MSITENSRVTLTVASVISMIVALVVMTWRVSATLNEIRGEMADMKREILAISNDQWTYADHTGFIYKLERLNRRSGLIVPGPDDKPRPQSSTPMQPRITWVPSSQTEP